MEKTENIEKEDSEDSGDDDNPKEQLSQEAKEGLVLTAEEIKKQKKKAKKKERKFKEQLVKKEYQDVSAKENEGKDRYEIEVAWCIKQLKLGLTNKGVTSDQGSQK